ncbi:septum formation protein Maf [Desulfoprunum benzoelyticum]|uniref:dTTP/UTP pyrophosphatase n=1 Tax=Desulfoprunum benzoelyticum TaxID=1506996 RepID=A0A840USJ4_9BACT|nr:Maf family protein [Desulfoprunum benzoelyticum]MBB5347806.1 septum formation protein [Desulfoprunum benzoelyticum]MBM9531672.1 septum formation protein Maf [Desulfoprunum benzoelyticum]
MFVSLKPLVLASNSPRRRAYFEDLGLHFTVWSADVDEQLRAGEDPEHLVLRLARDKALAVCRLFPASWIVAADTVVCVDGEVLGKPRDAEEAVAMLLALAGREHTVRTGFCVTCAAEGILVRRSVVSSVWFSDFGEDVARAYAATGEPLDKAGAYGIQGKGAFLVQRISGSYSNIVGLPLCEVLRELRRYKVVAPRHRAG